MCSSDRTRVTPGSAAADVRSARALHDHLPATRAALCRGVISPAHTSAIVRVVRTVGVEHARLAEPVLLDLARRFDPSVVRRASAELFAMVDPEGAERAQRVAYEKRGLTLSVVGDHGYLDGVLDLESTELLRAALEPLMARAGTGETRTPRSDVPTRCSTWPSTVSIPRSSLSSAVTGLSCPW